LKHGSSLNYLTQLQREKKKKEQFVRFRIARNRQKKDENGRRSGTHPDTEEQGGAAGEERRRQPLMAKEACGGRDFTVVTMGIHSGNGKTKKKRKRRGGEGQRQAAPQLGE
jgi:hypothetical protein